MKKVPIAQDSIKTIENFTFDEGQISDSGNGHSQSHASHATLKIPPDNTEEMCNFLDSIIACMPNNVYWLDRNCVLQGGNENLARIFGLKSRDELKGLTYQEMSKLANWEEGLADSFRNADIEVMISGKARYNIEVPPVIIDGRTRYFINSKVPLFNREGKVIGVVGISTDITEQKEAEAALRKAKEEADENTKEMCDFLDSIIACMPHNVYWLDRNCVLQGGNDNLTRMFGLKSRKELKGLTYEEMGKLANWTEGQGDSFRAVEQEVMAAGKPRFNIEEPPFIMNGKARYFLASKVPLFNKAGQVIGIVGISSDITEQKEAEAALRKAKEEAEVANQAKTYFIASLGHEFRTPLNHIMGLSEILRHNIDSLQAEEQKEYLKNIYDSGNDLLSLLNDIIFFSRIEMGYFKINPEKTPLREIITKVINSNQHRAAEKNITITLDYPENLPTHVWADTQRVRQVLVNLIENAIKFTMKGSIHISAQKEEPVTASSPPMVRINITDTGIGIPEEKMELLFKKFTQVHSNYRDQHLGRYPGVGLGLAITKELVELMDGNVNAVSKFGEGSTFSFSLPINPDYE